MSGLLSFHANARIRGIAYFGEKNMYRKLTLLVAMSLTLILTGCAGGPLSTRERLTLGGGALGAATGAVVGAATGGSAAMGAAIGGPVGLIGGFLIGDSLQGSSACRAQSSSPSSSYRVQGYERSAKKATPTKSTAAVQTIDESGEVF
jgi:osmotically inducible lipoprotein OsmB